MPQDTTIYWDGNEPLPSILDSVPIENRNFIIQEMYKHVGNEKLPQPVYISLFVLMILVVSAAFMTRRRKKHSSSLNNSVNGYENNHAYKPLTYKGKDLDFTDDVLEKVLTKRSSYYNKLSFVSKAKFLIRLKEFISSKTFVIHDESGFKEMPILISAAVIQVTFGLNDYLLQDYTIFNIYPAEFIRTQPFIRFLAGNVTSNTINLSWKHFLEGFEFADDGVNVGLHEIAHAIHSQAFDSTQYSNLNFKDSFTSFDDNGKKVFEQEKNGTQGLFTDYAKKDFQEFWAESVEIFFEKPVAMKERYPDLYKAMCKVLNQDTANLYAGGIA